MHADETQYGVCSAPLLPAQGHAHLDHVSDILYFVALLRPTIYLGGDFGWRTYVGLPIVAVQAALGWWKTASHFVGIRREIRCGRGAAAGGLPWWPVPAACGGGTRAPPGAGPRGGGRGGGGGGGGGLRPPAQRPPAASGFAAAKPQRRRPPPATDLPYRRRNKTRAGGHRHPAQLLCWEKGWDSFKRNLFP